MNKILWSFVFCLILFACKSSAPVSGPAPKLDRTAQSGIKGNWKITNVTYPGSAYFKVNSFQIADSKCFIGSIWSFIPNNNKGTMSLALSDCPSFSSPVVWSIDNEGMFRLKIVDPGVKAKTVTQGYLLKVSNQTGNSFQLIDTINVEGQKKEITYQFEKIN